MPRPITRRDLLAISLTVATIYCGSTLLAQQPQSDPQQLTRSEIENFLLRAEIVMSETLPIGVTQSSKASLSDGVITREAHVQTIDVFKRKFKIGNRTELNFRDSYKFNIAAYRIDKLLQLNMLPVSVERLIKGEPAAITWWVEDVGMMELDRTRRGVRPPDTGSWERQMSRVQVFTELIANDDQNQSNLLITTDWKIWLIDFTRAFRSRKTLAHPDLLERIEPSMLAALESLDMTSLRKEIGRYLSPSEIKLLLVRRDKIVAHFEARIRELGETAVLFPIESASAS
jgi:hypothetical protein